ncbi:hypothetical protein JOF28_001691 [Leucobacter exalbidus]|uniref:Uncharacterized protein n=1 Tax=Leucobacter exalbidus TaxID=662960 RepID=A0A940T450_9MICO|nr:hypothetical protein [Leucobacter exalbidus]MBP1326459.1 hypothetical protein [Leucobacter exalbidus]
MTPSLLLRLREGGRVSCSGVGYGVGRGVADGVAGGVFTADVAV